jgi:MinD-like ATPase involved in chromosome partitioning or flagellar assembly
VETVAFHSYKGGVGRSLLLANAALFLARLGKGVVALDFDFEAPGLHYKLGADRAPGDPSFTGGAVPYLVATGEGAASPPPLEDHMISVPVTGAASGWLRLMPAGFAPRHNYWAALTKLGDRLRLSDPSGQMALLDLRARIADEVKPDYLLVDTRAGVTELGGFATTTLADTVVCTFVANRESLDGTLTVIEALKKARRFGTQRPIRIVPVLSRTTATDNWSADAATRFLKLGEGKPGQRVVTLSMLPHDNLDLSEQVGASSPLHRAYLELFRELFRSDEQPE